jgi:hypothetical protein
MGTYSPTDQRYSSASPSRTPPTRRWSIRVAEPVTSSDRSGNPVNRVPKSETNNVNQSDTFDVRNGQTTGSFAVSPLSTLTCTGSQRVRILDVSFDLFLNGDDLPEVHLTG